MSTEMERRAEIIADYRKLLRFLVEHPEVPIRGSGLPSYCVLADDDEAGMAELARIGAALGVEVFDLGDVHPCVQKQFGVVTYEAYYVRRAAVQAYHEELRWAAERRAASAEGGGSDV